MLVPDRHRSLLDEVRRRGSAQVIELADALGVSPSTVRRDLAVLEADGRLLRARGGAYVRSPAASPLAVPEAASGSDEAKRRLGRRAVELIEDDMTVMILAGSTTATMLPFLAERSVTVVTNGLGVAAALVPHPSVTVVLLGGVLHRDQLTLLGPMAEQNMADLHVDVLFGGAYGVDADIGVTGAKVIQAGYHHSMLRHTESLVVLATGEKFGRQGPTLLARVDQVDTFITDADAPDAVLAGLREQGADVLVE